MIPRLDRSEILRTDEDRLVLALHDPGSRFVVFRGDRALLCFEPVEPAVLDGETVKALGLPLEAAVFLGLENKTAWFAVDVACGDAGTADLFEALTGFGSFLSLGPIEDPVEPEIWALLSQARALLAWNRATAYCPQCGGTTESQHGGYQRRCLNQACALTHFPRTDMAIIVRVLRGDRCLLARQSRFRPGLRSVLAGFVEPGEGLEGAVRREVLEEVGLELSELSYLGSQPWPFPMSMMIAFEAHAASDCIRIDEVEIESAAWYTRDQVREALASGSLLLPSQKSISRRMIDGWLEGNRQI